jgi:hypothetical protein
VGGLPRTRCRSIHASRNLSLATEAHAVRIHVAWTPCICEPAKEEVARGRGPGHIVLHCQAYEDEDTIAVFYDTACDTSQLHLR